MTMKTTVILEVLSEKRVIADMLQILYINFGLRPPATARQERAGNSDCGLKYRPYLKTTESEIQNLKSKIY